MGNIGKRIRPIRESLGLGRAEFARLCEISKESLIKTERESVHDEWWKHPCTAKSARSWLATNDHALRSFVVISLTFNR